MSGTAEIQLRFGPDEQVFKLGMGELRRIQETCDAGPMELMGRLGSGMWRIDDVRAPILHGLIGGGMVAEKAGVLVERYVDERPLSLSVNTAYAVLGAAILPPEDEPLGEKAAGEDQASNLSREESSASA